MTHGLPNQATVGVRCAAAAGVASKNVSQRLMSAVS
jgi:hypothetical protein